MSQKRIAIVGVGGTISMSAGPGGLAPTHSAQDLLTLVAAHHPGIAFEPLDLMRKPSASLTMDDVLALVRTIDRLAAAGAAGVVVTQGTDTLEEVAFAIALLSAATVPVVFTAAMRGASAPGYEGGANLSDAIRVALHAEGRPDVFVVMNGEAHAPHFVSKTHTASVAAFTSPNFGPLLRIHEKRVYEYARLVQARAPAIVLAPQPKWPRVALIQLGLGDDGALLRHLQALGYEGCILAATGGGHAADFAVDAIEAAARDMPVILCSRTGAGHVFEHTYDYPGAETDLLKRGVIADTCLGPDKARVLLTLCLAQGRSGAGERFHQISRALFNLHPASA